MGRHSVFRGISERPLLFSDIAGLFSDIAGLFSDISGLFRDKQASKGLTHSGEINHRFIALTPMQSIPYAPATALNFCVQAKPPAPVHSALHQRPKMPLPAPLTDDRPVLYISLTY